MAAFGRYGPIGSLAVRARAGLLFVRSIDESGYEARLSDLLDASCARDS